MKIKVLSISYCLLTVFSAVSLGATSPWELYPAVRTVNDLIYIDGYIWAATNSGLVKYKVDNGSYQFFTTVDGLSSVEVDAMAADDLGNLILGMGNAYIDIFNMSSNQVIRLADLTLNDKIFKIYDMTFHDGAIYVATDIGVSKLVYYDNLDKYLIEGTYANLGDFTPEIPVTQLLVYEQGLWAGTESGLARGDLTQPVLESPESWANYTTSNGLLDNEVQAMTIHHDSLYVCVNYGDNALHRLVDLAEGFEATGVTYARSNLLYSHSDTLYLGRYNGLYRLNGSTVEGYGDLEANPLSLVFDDDDKPWTGTVYTTKSTGCIPGGLNYWDGEKWNLNDLNSNFVETVTDILVEDNGAVWVTGRLEVGTGNGTVSHYDGSNWVAFGRHLDYPTTINDTTLAPVSPDSFFWYWTKKITMDQTGSVWVASDGRGTGWFSFDNDTLVANGFYSASNNYLFNIEFGAHYCVVRDLLTDSFGNIWICNSEASEARSGDRPIAVVPSDFIEDPVAYPNWYYLPMKNELGMNLPQAEFYVDRIATDSYGYKWFGGNNNTGEDKGIWILDDNQTISNSDDDHWYHVLGLPSDSITAITRDRDGIMWVGTSQGVQYFYPSSDPASYSYNGIDLYNMPIGLYINCIAVDPQNNKWFGTNSGINVLSADNFTWLNSYTDIEGDYPSPLPGNTIQAIEFNKYTGEAYLGTEKGLAKLSTPFRQMGQKVTDVSIIANQNPFLVGNGIDERLFFDATGLSETVQMKIFTVAGFLVREMTKEEIIAGWDGRNERGELVGSGIYLLLAYDPDGNADVGKVAVIHK